MKNVFLAWQNRTDEGGLSGGSWLPSLPLVNLQNRQVQKVARSTDASPASTRFVIDLGQARPIGVLALVVHNISVLGQVRVTASDVAGFERVLYDSGAVDVWPAGMIPQALLEWEDDNFWLGTLSQQARAGYQSPFIHLLPVSQTLRFWKVEVLDGTNPDGYVHIGRLFMAAGWRPGRNFAYGNELVYEDPTPIEASLSGAEFFDSRAKYRVFRFSLPALTDDEAYSRVLELQRLAGISGEVLLVPDSDDITRMPQRAFVGRLRSIGALAQQLPARQGATFEIKELL